MRILLVGEFSRLHNSLKEGLTALGHEVVLIANGDGFKNYPADLSTKAKWCETWLGNIPRQIIFRLTLFDIATIEFGIRFYFHLKKLKNFDVVQLINESAIQTTPRLERFLLRKLFRQNKNTFLLCCGVDYEVACYLMSKKGKYSIMNPFFEQPESKSEYQFVLDFLSENHKKTHDLIYQNCKGVIASDYDYVLPMQDNPYYLGLIPNPINIATIKFSEIEIETKIVIFLGINRGTYYTKGISFFEKAMVQILEKYSDKIEYIVAENLPYNEYISFYNKAHILLDQVYGYDQGYNALEAMAKGKVVFTGAEQEFLDFYHLQENEVVINALPDVDDLVQKLSFLIENPKEITKIGHNARKFIELKHDYVKSSELYLEKWNCY